MSDMTTMPDKPGKPSVSVREITILAFIAAVMLVSQVALAPIPNVELVSLIIISCTVVYGWKMLLPLYIFVLLEGLIYGFALWWIGYLYVWLILVGVVMLFRSFRSAHFFAMVAGVFGLLFGALFAIIDLVIGGWAFAFTKWVAGIPFDFIHCASNAVVTFILFKPTVMLLERLNGGGQKS